MSQAYHMSPNTRTKLEVEEVIKRRFRITCGNCGYSWVSETKTEKRMSCSKCKTTITLPPNLRSPSSTATASSTSPSFHPETIVWIDKAWTAAREKKIMFLDQLFNNPSLTRAQKLQRYAQHFRDVAMDKVLDDVPESREGLLKRADYYEKLACSPTVDSEPNPRYDTNTNSIRNLKILVDSSSWSSSKEGTKRLLEFRQRLKRRLLRQKRKVRRSSQ